MAAKSNTNKQRLKLQSSQFWLGVNMLFSVHIFRFSFDSRAVVRAKLFWLFLHPFFLILHMYNTICKALSEAMF